MTITVQEVARYLRMGGTVPEGALATRIGEMIDEAARVLRPARIWRRLPVAQIPSPGTTLLRHLEGCDEAYLACGTLGPGLDALQRRVSVTSGADALIVQAVRGERPLRNGSAHAQIAGDFPLAAQRDILAILDTSRRIGVSLTDSLLMVPSKSVSAVVGVA